jgi:hypothetical protein
MALIKISKKEFNQTFLGLLLTSFYGYLPHLSFLFIFITMQLKLGVISRNFVWNSSNVSNI